MRLAKWERRRMLSRRSDAGIGRRPSRSIVPDRIAYIIAIGIFVLLIGVFAVLLGDPNRAGFAIGLAVGCAFMVICPLSFVWAWWEKKRFQIRRRKNLCI